MLYVQKTAKALCKLEACTLKDGRIHFNTAARKSGNIPPTYLKAFFVRHSSGYENVGQWPKGQPKYISRCSQCVYLKLPWIGNISSEFENQISKAITSCYYVVKPRVVYNTRVMLPSAKKDCVSTTQKSCVVYEFSCPREARYVGRTTQRLADRIKQHVPTSIRKKSNTVREQPPRICTKNNSKINC